MRRLLALSISLCVCCPGAAYSDSLLVPSDYATIQEAVDAASPGDEVVIECGTYEDVGIVNLKDSVDVRSELSDPTCAELRGVGFSAQHTDLTVEGITFDTPAPFRTAALWTSSSSGLRITGCRFQNFETGIVSSVSFPLEVTDCEFVGNTYAGNNGAAGIRSTNCDLIVLGCTFELNTATAGYGNVGAIASASAGTLRIEDCSFTGNEGDVAGGVWAQLGGPHEIRRSTFIGNAGTGAKALSSGINDMVVEDCLFTDVPLAGAPRRPTVVADGPVIRVSRDTRLDLLRSTVAGHNYGGWSIVDVYNRSQFNAVETIFAFNQSVAELVRCVSPTGVATAQCSILYANVPADGCITGQIYTLDPSFCNPAAGDFTLQGGSPALPAGNGCGVQIGVFGQACGPVSVAPESWGKIKAGYK